MLSQTWHFIPKTCSSKCIVFVCEIVLMNRILSTKYEVRTYAVELRSALAQAIGTRNESKTKQYTEFYETWNMVE